MPTPHPCSNREWFIEQYKLHGSFRAISRAHGFSGSTVSRWGRIHGVDSVAINQHDAARAEHAPAVAAAAVAPRSAEPVELIRARRTEDRLRSENTALKKQLKHGAKSANLLDDVRDILQPVLDAPPMTPPTPRKLSVSKSVRKPVSLVLHLTDIHWGEIVDGTTINGVNNYDPDIAARRVQRAVDATVAWIANYQALGGVSEIVVVVNGDTVSGQHTIHPDSATEYARIAVQVLDARLVVAQVVSELSRLVPRVRYIGTHGNHPRSTHRMPTGAARTQTSWETMLHEGVADLLMAHENVTFQLAKGYTVTTDIGPSKWGFSHGDAVAGGGGALGIPAYGLKRQHDSMREWSLALAEIESASASAIVRHSRYGHFHTYLQWSTGTGDIALAPSPKGVDSYVKDKLGKYSRAGFLLEAVHPDLDIIGTHLIDVQDIQDSVASCRYVWGAQKTEEPSAQLMKAWLADA